MFLSLCKHLLFESLLFNHTPLLPHLLRTLNLSYGPSQIYHSPSIRCAATPLSDTHISVDGLYLSTVAALIIEIPARAPDLRNTLDRFFDRGDRVVNQR